MIKEKVDKVLSDLATAAKTSSRKPEDIVLVGVTKYAPLEAIQEAIDAGIKHIAENRVQEAEKKFPPLLAKNTHVRSHIIGHLQSNKAKDAIKVCSMIQSLDSLKLAQEIEKQAAKGNQLVDVLVQFNTAREEQKFGAMPEEALSLMEAISILPHVNVKGLMCMAPYTDDQGIIRKTFADLRAIRDDVKKRFAGHKQIHMDIMSFGMSGDYKIAIEEGSTMIRVGSAIFKDVMTQVP
jgi:PLP dependent protein